MIDLGIALYGIKIKFMEFHEDFDDLNVIVRELYMLVVCICQVPWIKSQYRIQTDQQYQEQASELKILDNS